MSSSIISGLRIRGLLIANFITQKEIKIGAGYFRQEIITKSENKGVFDFGSLLSSIRFRVLGLGSQVLSLSGVFVFVTTV